LWGRRFGGAGEDRGYAVTTDAGGNVVMAAVVRDQAVDFGGGPLPLRGSYDMVLAKFSSAGAHLWSQCRGGVGDDFPTALASDAPGTVVVTGYFTGTSEFAGSALVSAGSGDVFVARYAPTGAPLTSSRFGGTAFDQGYGVAVGPGGNVLVTGGYSGSVDFGSG